MAKRSIIPKSYWTAKAIEKANNPVLKINWPTEVFSVDEAKSFARDDMESLRSAYSRYRSIAQRRIERMGKSEFADTKTYAKHAGGFAKLSDLSEAELPKAFSELSKFVNAKSSSITGQKAIREKTIKTLRAQGLDVNEQNYNAMIKVFEEMRSQKLIYGSDKALEVADYIMHGDDDRREMVLSNLKTYLENADELEIPEGPGVSADDIEDMFDDDFDF